ncbi:MAG TPA: hypothetical protein VK524_23220, partial [Polyangiaceae bacterium]|nr:hypothetical protein [Polyangiaceae bacterium]
LTTAVWGTRAVALVRLALHETYTLLDVRNEPALASFRAELRRQMATFPAEPYFPQLGALVAWRTNADPMPWLTRTLERDQSAGRAHLLLANVLARRQAQSQALMELRLAIEGDPSLSVRASQLAIDWTRDPERLMRVVPDGTQGVEPLVAMAKRVPGREYDELRERLIDEALRRNPDSPRVLLTHAEHLFEALTTGVDRCRDAARAKCVATLESHARRLRHIDPRSFAGTEIVVRLLIAQGQAERAAQRLDRPCFDFIDVERCLRLRMTVAFETKNHDALTQAARDYATSICSGPRECARVATWIGEFFRKRRMYAQAVSYLESAARDDPSVHRWLAVADSAEAAGATGRQLNALQHVQRLPGGESPAVQARLNRAKDSTSLFLLRKTAIEARVP